MEENYGPNSKKRKEMGSFITEFKDIDKLRNAYNSLCFDRRNPLIVQQITSCNAAAGYGVHFSRASCETCPFTGEIYPFGSLFIDAIRLLNDFFTETEYIPGDRPSKFLLEMLLQFLVNEDSHSALRRIQRQDVAKTESMVVLAEHLFSKLSLSDTYKIDQSAKYKGTLLCQCGSCKPEHASSCLGDTSIGNPDGWHGSLDIVLGCDECFVHVASPENKFGRESLEMKQKHVEERGFRSQTLAQIIVFSFLQKQRHPNLDHFLVPCIAATKSEIKVYFYDSKHDILMESRGMNLFIDIPGTKTQPLNYEAILAVWLVVNYKFLCSGPHEYLLQVPKARFHEHAGPSIDIYEKELSIKNVRSCSCFANYDFIDILKPKFAWPSDLSFRPLMTEKN